MTDISVNYDDGAFDLAITGNDLETDEGLRTAVTLSLYTNRRAPDDAVLPPEFLERGGWWGDIGDEDGYQLGSLLWLLQREKTTAATVAKAEQYAAEALQWLIDDGVASAVNVTAERAGLDIISLSVEVIRPTGTALDLRFASLWEAQSAV